MRMSDWSSDVCSSELVQGLAEALRCAQAAELDLDKLFDAISGGAAQSWQMDKHWKTMAADSFDFGFAVGWMRKDLGLALAEARANGATDRKSVVSGKSGSVRVDLGGRRIIKKKISE